jgi:hypothetical protein
MSRAPPSRNYTDGRRDSVLEGGNNQSKKPKTAFDMGLSISQLQSQFLIDAATLEGAEFERRYPRDHKSSVGFLETRAKDRPTSFHLRSPFYVDQYDIEYTPRDIPLIQSMFARISPAKAAQLRRALNSGQDINDPSEIGVFCFPPPGTVLKLRIHPRFRRHLRAVHGAADAAQLLEQVEQIVTVLDVVAPKTASAEIVLAEPFSVRQDLIYRQIEAE